MRRTKFLCLGLGLVLGLLIGPVGASGSDNDNGRETDRRGTIVRWDLVQFVEDVVVSGGTDVSATSGGDTIALTGSGHAEPRRDKAFGGGTFVHTSATGTVEGVYYVTGFKSWQRLRGGSIVGILTDGIGPIRRATSGILKLDVHLVAAGGTPQFDGTLTIFCHLPGTIRDAPEGIALEIPAGELNFDQQVEGFTLFHVIRPLGALP